jgi:hypothetical protein
MNTLEFELKRAGAGWQRLSVDASVARVGSAAHCELRLPPGEAAAEQLVVELRNEGVFVDVFAREPAVTLDDVPFRGGIVPAAASLCFGGIELRVQTPLRARQRVRAGTPRARHTPLLYGAILLLLPLGLLLLLGAHRTASSLEGLDDLPALWSNEEAPACPQKDARAAGSLAERELAEADSRARAPYSVGDGMLAADLYRRVAACLLVAGEAERAQAAAKAAGNLAQELSTSFHAHQVAFERALAGKRYESARSHLQALLLYVGARSDAYSDSLRSLRRQIDLQLSQKKER